MTTHPPTADKLVMVDFDGTIAPWGELMETAEPFPGVVGAMQEMRRRGYRIGIFTSRLSTTWLRQHYRSDYPDRQLHDQLIYVKSYLDQYEIPFDFITAEKVPAEAYFDDKAVAVTPGSLPGALLAFATHQS